METGRNQMLKLTVSAKIRSSSSQSSCAARKRGGGRPASARTLSTSRTGNTSGRQGRGSVPCPYAPGAQLQPDTFLDPNQKSRTELAEHRADTSPASSTPAMPSSHILANVGRLRAGVTRSPDGMRWATLGWTDGSGLAAVPVAAIESFERVLAEAERELTELGLVAFRAVCRPDVADIDSCPGASERRAIRNSSRGQGPVPHSRSCSRGGPWREVRGSARRRRDPVELRRQDEVVLVQTSESCSASFA